MVTPVVFFFVYIAWGNFQPAVLRPKWQHLENTRACDREQEETDATTDSIIIPGRSRGLSLLAACFLLLDG